MVGSHTFNFRVAVLLNVYGEQTEIEIDVAVHNIPGGPQGGTWNRQIGTWEPPDAPEAELQSARWPDGGEVPTVMFEALQEIDWSQVLVDADVSDPALEDPRL